MIPVIKLPGGGPPRLVDIGSDHVWARSTLWIWAFFFDIIIWAQFFEKGENCQLQ